MPASAHPSHVDFVFARNRNILNQFTSFISTLTHTHTHKIKKQTSKTSESNQDLLLKHSGRSQNGKTHDTKS